MRNRVPEHGENYLRGEILEQKPYLRWLGVMRRHLWIILAAFLIISTITVLRAYRAVPVFQAVAKIMIERQAPTVTHFEGVVQPNVTWGAREYYRTQEQLARSRAVLEIALERPEISAMFGEEAGDVPLRRTFRQTLSALLQMPAPEPPENWERLRGFISSEQVRDTYFLYIRAEASNRQKAALLATAVAEAFVEFHRRNRRTASNDAFVYLEEQKEKEETALQLAQQKLQEFRQGTQSHSLDLSEVGHPVMKRLTLLNEQLTQAQMERINLEAELRVVRRALASGTDAFQDVGEQVFSLSSIRKDPRMAEIRSALIAAEEEAATLADIYGPQHPNYVAVSTRMNLLKGKLSEALLEIVESLTSRLEVVQGQEKELQAEYDQQNAAAMTLANQSLEFRNLQNEVDRHQKLYSVLLERMSEVELTSDYAKTNVELIEAAALPKAPVRPNKISMVVKGLLLGLVLGIALAFFVEYMDETVRSPEDIELRVGIPVLGFIPRIRLDREASDKEASRVLVYARGEDNIIMEAYRNLRTLVFFARPVEGSKVLLMSSAGPGDGKTTTAANLAMTIAKANRKVLLVDADFRRPMITKYFGLSAETGLSSVLAGESPLEDALQKTVVDLEVLNNLDILSAGPMPPDSGELLDSSRMDRLLMELRDKYDRIIIDAPPVLYVTDASILAAKSDGVILVVKAGRRTAAFVRRAVKHIENVQGKVIGGVLNMVNVPRFGHYYSDYYYYGYARKDSAYYASEKSRSGR
ncbi:MAG: polysaccharide biosynthesis tyrosine autokinase [Kiritimatiellae bacterium]|nr:polysaccharide biosynthesis tyrosine autokinase [Kiritimatiellia bacterium]